MFKTQAQRTLEQVLARQRAEREQREAEEAQQLEAQKQSNAEARKAYLSKLAAERAAKQAEADARLDQQLEPEKQRTGREWLANHLGKSQSDFEQVWTAHLRANAVENLERAKGEALRASLRASGQYSF